MTRHEFSKPTRRAALARSGGVCEASGRVYGLQPETRCTALLSYGVEFDHYPLPAHAEDSAKIDNCVACCPACHAWKTRTYDIPIEAKIKRVQRAHGRRPDNRKPRPKMKGPGFQKGSRPMQSRQFERQK